MTVNATAAVLRDGQAPYRLETLELEEPGAGEILVRIVAAGHCHTDLFPRAQLAGVRLPLVCGHEGAGVVERIGDGGRRVSVGDHVLLSSASCGGCRGCVNHQPYACASFVALNFAGHPADGVPRARDA